ncbi:MAG: glycosyltransferase family 4 protein [Butyrivibrio sp.]|nr:glycosyltransferase family 4 protein [Butyrivibrio sp.]
MSIRKIIDKIMKYYPLWGLILVTAAEIAKIKLISAGIGTTPVISSVYLIITIMIAIFIATLFAIYRTLHVREFLIRYWPLTLAAIITFLHQITHISGDGFIHTKEFVVYFLTYTGFLYGKKYKKILDSVPQKVDAFIKVLMVAGLAWWVLEIVPHKTIPAGVTEAIHKSLLGKAAPYVYSIEFALFVILGIKLANKKYSHRKISKKHPLIINGRIYAQSVTGVQRYGIEIIKQIDKMVKPGEVILALPQGELQTEPEFKNIKTEVIGKGNGNKWTQFHLPMFAFKKKGTILSLAGIAPVIKPDYIATHDISFMRYPESYGKAFRLTYRIGYLLTLYRCKGIITISKFSRDELIEFYQLDKSRFTIAGNSAEQVVRDLEDDKASNRNVTNNKDREQNTNYKQNENTSINDTLAKWGLKENEPYYLSVGSKNLHKNQKFIKKLAKKYPDRKFVVAGGSSQRSFGASGDLMEDEPNLILTGYISDEDLRVLYRNAYAFIFPSLYEGFGIPPMEAIVSGVQRIALADIPVLREIYTRGCYFFDPKNVDSFDMDRLDRIDKKVTAKSIGITEEVKAFYRNRYTWNNSAKNIYKTMR